jgi:tetratricopeptide (TPR) repeat protein
VLARARRRERELARAGDRVAYTPERIALLSMFSTVVCFGAHSLVDWTWYVPGDACVALLFAGWLAGRGPLGAAQAVNATRPVSAPGAPPLPGTGVTTPRRWSLHGDARAIALAGAAVVLALVAAWAQWQPQRSESAREQSLTLLATNPLAARERAEEAASIDPLNVEALFALSRAQLVQGKTEAAHETLARAVRMQPSDPRTWLALGESDLTRAPRSALSELSAAIYLDPESIAPELIARGVPEAITIENEYVQALRASGGQ